VPHQTPFTSFQFVEAVSRAMGEKYRLFAIPVIGSGPPRTMYAASAPAPYRSRYVWLAPFSLYASPGWESDLERATLEGIMRRLKRASTRGLVWTVRFDHTVLARGLRSFDMPFQQAATHVLWLDRGYAHAASSYSASIRNQIRKAARRGVCVRDAESEADVQAYCELHARLVEQRDWRGFRYPMALLLELIRLKDFVRVLIAEHDGRIVSGALFFRDADSVLYWHAATDRRYSHLFASRPILDEAIRWACDSGARFVDLGGSAGIASLEQFKSSWGARPEMNSVFEWTNPLWAGLSALKSRFRRPLQSPDSRPQIGSGHASSGNVSP
jgi:Acetyltransferase (GNAT) domain